MLPALIEIVPPNRRTDSTIVLPGSKSLTNRALVLAALARCPVERGHASDGELSRAVGLRHSSGGRSGRSSEPHPHGLWLRRGKNHPPHRPAPPPARS